MKSGEVSFTASKLLFLCPFLVLAKIPLPQTRTVLMLALPLIVKSSSQERSHKFIDTVREELVGYHPHATPSSGNYFFNDVKFYNQKKIDLYEI